MRRLVRPVVLGTIIGANAAHAGRVPAEVQEELARLHAAHGAPILVLADDPEILKDLGRWLSRSTAPHLARRIPTVGTRTYERQIALDRSTLRCGLEVDGEWETSQFGDCNPWGDGPTLLHASVPQAQPETERSRRVERAAAVALGPVMSTGTIVDVSLEARLSRKGAIAFIHSAVHVREWGSPALFAGQGRRYFLGDVDRGMYALAQVGVLSTELGTVHSPGAAVGLGLKYTTKPGLMADGYIGAGPAWPVPIHPAFGARIGWAF